MNNEITIVLTDYQGRNIRCTVERRAHILEHPEINGQLALLEEILLQPEEIVATNADESVRVYHRFYPKTPVTSKYLQVAIKMMADDAFVLTAFGPQSAELRNVHIEDLKVWYDNIADHLEVMFEDVPASIEEVDEDFFERRSTDGRVVGFAVFNFSKHDRAKVIVPLPVTAVPAWTIGGLTR